MRRYINYNIIIEQYDKHGINNSSNRIKIQFDDNMKATVEDLKEYICGFYNYQYCPCYLELFKAKERDKDRDRDRNKLIFRNMYINDLDQIKYENKDLLSNIVKDRCFRVVIMLNNQCHCSKDYKDKYHLKKSQLINRIS